MSKRIVINLAGGPGSGKSTTMAGVFYNLKKRGYNCEMAPEFAKEKVWEESYKMMDDQAYIFGKQFHRMWRIADKVDIIITDAPLFVTLYYDGNRCEDLAAYVMKQFRSFNNITYFIERDPDNYQTEGRIQSKEHAELIDKDIKKIMEDHHIDYHSLKQRDAVEEIVDFVIKNIEK